MAEVRGLSSNIMSRNRATTATATNHREMSPDSMVLTFESHLSSLFSSSASRCSFASNATVDSLSSDLSHSHSHSHSHSQLHLSGGPDLEIPSSNKTMSAVTYHKVDKPKELDNKRVPHYDDVDNAEYDSEIQPLDSARTSFSVALKECQERRSRSEALQRKLDRRRPSSFDLNNSSSSSSTSGSNSVGNVVSSSPNLGVNVMKKGSISSRKSGNFPSPGTPNYRHRSVVMGLNKGWSSERVPLPSNGSGRQVGTGLLPLNNGKALPSKWEDAERWIFSPVDGSARHSSYNSQQQRILRRPKSKSGPLGPPGVAYYSMYSHAVPMYDGHHHMDAHIGGSPFSAGAMMADTLSIRGVGTSARGFSDSGEPCIARSVSIHGCTDLVCQSSIASSLDEKADNGKDGATNVSRAVSRRDMATQMSPEGSRHSSPGRLSFSPSTPSKLPIVEVPRYSISSSKPEPRDVQIDERVKVIRWSKKYRGRSQGLKDVDDWNMKAVESRSSSWEMSDSMKNISKVRREEAKITAWENLQKAKAEAAIRELEMKLEKKRSSSMTKIMKKLRSAQKKAQEMRSIVLANQRQVSNSNNRAISIRTTRQIGSLSGCFTCHAF